MAGLTANGFEKKNLDTIKQELEDAFRTSFGKSINLKPGSIFQTIVGIFSERESLIWDLAEEVYNSQYPDTASGNNLDNVVAINGITRLAATKSTQPNQLLFGVPGTLVPAGTQLSVEGNPTAKFVTKDAVTLVAGANEKQTLTPSGLPASGSYKLTYRGQTTAAISWNALAQGIQDALNALVNLEGVIVTGNLATSVVIEFAGAGGLQAQPMLTISEVTMQDSLLNPVSLTNVETVAGAPQGVVDLEATETGVVDAPIGTLVNIDTPVSGLDSTINIEPTTLGRARETDAELRLRRSQTLQVAGNATPDAIRSRLLNIIGVRNALVFENRTMSVDGEGRPPKSYEPVVDGGDDQDIADVLWFSKPTGMEMYGDIEMTVTDSQGDPRLVYFSRPGEIGIYYSIDLLTDPLVFPANGAVLARDAINAWGNSLGIGGDIIVYPRLVSQLNAIPGILDVTVRIDTAPVSTTAGDPAVDDNIIIGPSDVASFDPTRSDINVLT